MENIKYTPLKAKRLIAVLQKNNDGINWSKLNIDWKNKKRIPKHYIDKAFNIGGAGAGKNGNVMKAKHGSDTAEFTYNDLLYILDNKKLINQADKFLNTIERVGFEKTVSKGLKKFESCKQLLTRMKVVDKDGFFSYPQTARLNRKLAIEFFIRFAHIERKKGTVKFSGEAIGNKIEYTLNDLLYLFAKQKRVLKMKAFLKELETNFTTYKDLLETHNFWFKLSGFIINEGIADRQGNWLLIEQSDNHQLACKVTLGFYHHCKK